MDPSIKEDKTQQLRETLSPTELASSLSNTTLRQFSKVDLAQPRVREMSGTSVAGIERRKTQSFLELESVAPEGPRLTPNEIRSENKKTVTAIQGHLERPEGVENMKTNAERQLEVAVGVVTPAVKAIYEHAAGILGAKK